MGPGNLRCTSAGGYSEVHTSVTTVVKVPLIYLTWHPDMPYQGRVKAVKMYTATSVQGRGTEIYAYAHDMPMLKKELLGHLGGAVSKANNSWFQLR